ncbi:MAG: 1-acyl-sn-glycerol-3-phosphate acyltransferase [Bacteroidales bacterium]|nr:1-acyl-sn-glycerol-3-phosphate acyltransferase [Bacteroidales bacterium]
MTDIFDDIRPYSEEEAPEKIAQIIGNETFINTLKQFIPEYTPEQLQKDARHFNTIYDFQYATSRRYIEKFIQLSTAGVTYKGLENISPDKNYVFIGNHRDITFDAAILEEYLFLNHYNTTKIAIGDNLVSSRLLAEVGMLNKMFIVKRSVSMREKITNYQHLAAYIHHVLFNEHESVWIAQRDGRTKDGLDITKQGLVKMLAMDEEQHPMDMLRKINLTPITISYEYEPCDKLKARELALSEEGPYHKQQGEDFNSIIQGIMGYKGKAQLTIGKPILEELDTIPEELNQNDKIYEVCKMVDQQIYQNYKLYPNNYIAFDLIDKKNKFKEHYTTEEKEKFVTYIDKQAETEDVPKEKMTHYLLRIYANPVTTSLNIKYQE